jgi:hypothetical protein
MRSRHGVLGTGGEQGRAHGRGDDEIWFAAEGLGEAISAKPMSNSVEL